MARFSIGTYLSELGFCALDGDLAVTDRQLAWELYTRIVTRVSLRGKTDARGEDTFRGEVLAEGFDEVDAFARDAVEIMVRYPVGRLEGRDDHLGFFIARVLEVVIRQFLEKWQSEYRSWWEVNKVHGAPFVVQRNFPRLDELLGDWTALRRFFRSTLVELSTTYSFVDVMGELTPDLQRSWYDG